MTIDKNVTKIQMATPQASKLNSPVIMLYACCRLENWTPTANITRNIFMKHNTKKILQNMILNPFFKYLQLLCIQSISILRLNSFSQLNLSSSNLAVSTLKLSRRRITKMRMKYDMLQLSRNYWSKPTYPIENAQVYLLIGSTPFSQLYPLLYLKD